jgi:hypothetical protein
MLRPASSRKYQPGSNARRFTGSAGKTPRQPRYGEGLTLDVSSGQTCRLSLSPLDDGKASIVIPGADKASNENIRDYAKLVRWVRFDPVTEKTRLYAYPLPQCVREQTGNAKLGDLVALGNTALSLSNKAQAGRQSI